MDEDPAQGLEEFCVIRGTDLETATEHRLRQGERIFHNIKECRRVHGQCPLQARVRWPHG